MTQHPATRATRMSVPTPVEGRPVGVPLYQNAIFAFDTAAELAAAFTGPDQAFLYSGYGNPTVRALEDGLADLEGGVAGLATGSGMSAINAVLFALLRAGDHVIVQEALYGGTHAALSGLAERWGITVSSIPGDDPAELTAALRPRTRLLVMETIANPTCVVPDLPGLVAAARAAGVATVVDNTFATPMLCRPLEFGADVVVHSATKYLGGHHDVIGGVAVFADADLHRRTWRQAVTLGAAMDPFAAWLVIRGMKTLSLRVAAACSTAAEMASRLAEHPAVATVHYPGLAASPSHARATKLLDGGYGGTLALDLAAPHAFLDRLRLILNAGSLGGPETVAMHPATTSHRSVDPAVLARAGVTAGTVRIALGLEHPDDLWADIAQALP
ncbi:trans-sulfuration enzyme family protein [Actinokineospora fastidiosa]|uniref:homocysteine desulfhydrase n=1 Tax=Actinokineospora fastidiosa TaxID=1816 RepID=A0A918GNN5_9PSEU|nr:aminotransferase class I/II-fold pyridoxal phosphate-dependent enzyme [Actinokineospora fastidiosa]GGS49244.1 methionine gamma-lyase [Actinokineospora fastidiosa]